MIDKIISNLEKITSEMLNIVNEMIFSVLSPVCATYTINVNYFLLNSTSQNVNNYFSNIFILYCKALHHCQCARLRHNNLLMSTELKILCMNNLLNLVLVTMLLFSERDFRELHD